MRKHKEYIYIYIYIHAYTTYTHDLVYLLITLNYLIAYEYIHAD